MHIHMALTCEKQLNECLAFSLHTHQIFPNDHTIFRSVHNATFAIDDPRQPMAPSSREQNAGGFLRSSLPSPPASSVSSPSAARPILLQPRSRPLRSGSSKESDFINHVERKLLAISRRYENRFSATLSEEANPDVKGRGYTNIGEEVQDLDPVVDLIWISGTRMIWFHVCYLGRRLINRCSLLTDCFPPHHRPHGDDIFTQFPIHATTDLPASPEVGPNVRVAAERCQR